MIHASVGVQHKEVPDWRLEIKTEKDFNTILSSGLAWVVYKDFPWTWAAAKKELDRVKGKETAIQQFTGYVGFLEWCYEYGYDDATVLSEEAGDRREATFYVKHKTKGTYAQILVYRDYYKGWLTVSVVKEGLTRKEKQITVTQVTYEES